MDHRQTTFRSISGKNVIAGTNVAGPLNLTINNNDSDGEHPDPAPCYSIPFPRNECVIHRTTISNRLAALLPPSREYHSAALWGLGGSGKTQIALDYAYRKCYDDPACSVFWVHADSETSFVQDYKSVARKLGLPESLSGKDLLMKVRAGIEANRCWLLIIDNADNLQLFGVRNVLRIKDQDQTGDTALNLSDFVPRGPVGTVLWISRDKGIDSIVGAQRAVEVPCMAEDEAMELLITVGNFGNGELDGAPELLTELGCFPLALSQAATFMQKMSITIREYLSRLVNRKKRWGVLQTSAHDPCRRQGLTNSILKTWDTSMEQIRRENEVVFDILHILAFLDNQNIPFEILYQAVTHRNKWIRDNGENDKNDSEDEYDKEGSNEDDSDGDVEEEALWAAARLQQLSFLQPRASKDKGRAYEMNRLVQEATLYALTNKARRKDQVRYSRLALWVVADLLPNNGPGHWDGCERYMVHAQRAITWAESCGEEIRTSWLLTKVSTRGMCNESDPINKMVCELRQKRFDRYHPVAINGWVSLPVTYRGQRKDKEATKINTQNLALQRDILGERDSETLQNIDICRDILGTGDSTTR